MAAWTTPADVEAKLRRRWSSGAALRAYAEDEPWEPVAIALRGPSATEIGADLAAVQSWVRTWQRVTSRLGRLDYRTVGGRKVGVNELPAKVWVDSYDDLWAALGVGADATRYAALVKDTRVEYPRLVPWMLRRPHAVLEHAAQWPSLMAVVRWVETHGASGHYLRQVDVPGVDTKFIDRHRLVLADLLDLQLGPDRIDPHISRAEFARRYGFARRPSYVRIRSLTPGGTVAGPYAEASVRADELAAHPPAARTVYVIENETTYLAFPQVDDAVAIFGGGYAVSLLESQDWLVDRELVYWGDIDTHGFSILDRVRRRFGHTRSILMDRATLLAHEAQWVREDSPHVGSLEFLTSAEAELYRELVEDTLGPSVRLEQERVRYSAIEQALRSGPRTT